MMTELSQRYFQPNLFFGNISRQDVEDLKLVNDFAKLSARRKLCYAIKEAILRTFGYSVGYDKQEWIDYEFDSHCYANDWCYCPTPCGIYAWHIHILERFVLGGRVFHVPTPEFLYGTNGVGTYDKCSPNFHKLAAQCLTHIKGRKPYVRGYESREEAEEALDRLLGKYGKLLKR